ncbi:MAG: peptide ABC transporter substrate-binding protein [Eubacteriales bacterium]
MPKRFASLMLSLIIILLSFAACSKNDGSNMDLIFPISAEPVSLDPQIAKDKTEKIIVNNCLEGLVRIGANGEILPGVALNWDISADGLEYTFHLRDNAQWHLISTLDDVLGKGYEKTFNTSVTAHDFVYALRRALSPVTKAPDAASLFLIKNAEKVNSGALASNTLGVAAINDFTLKISIINGSSDFLNLLASPVCMPCNEMFFTATKGKYGLDDKYLLCNGPFYLSNWSQLSSLFLRRNKDYKGNSEVSPNSVSLSISPDSGSYLQKLSQGVYIAAPLSAAEAAKVEKGSSITLVKYSNITWSLCFNCEDTSLKNVSLRVALCKAIDKAVLSQNLAKKIKNDYFVPACCVIGQTPFRELAKGGCSLSFDTAGAKRSWGNGLEKTGYTAVPITLICSAEYEKAMRQMFQQWQKTLGISLSITIEVLEDTEIKDRVASGDYQIALAPIQANKSSAIDFLQSFTTANVGNVFNYKSNTYDNILKQLKKGGNSAQTVAGCRKAEANLMRNGVVYPLFSESSYFALAKGASGIYSTPAGENVCFIQGKKLK